MALQTPTTKEISDNILAQFETSFGQDVPILKKAFLRVLSKVLAGVFILLYKYGGFMFLQIFVKTAAFSTTEINGNLVSPLIEWGRLIGIGDPAAGTQAELEITITVENQIGSLASGTQFINNDNGVTYILLAPVVLDAATKSGQIRAVSDQAGGGGVGSIGNLDNGAIVSFVNPLANVARDATVSSTLVTGAPGETEEAYRQRILDRFQKRPQGGSYADYEQWAEAPAGILNVYPYTSATPGQVDLYVEATEASSGSPDGIPTGAQLTEVLDAVEPFRPATALVNAFAITRTGFDVTVTGLSSVEDVAAVESAITDAVDEYFRSRGPYIIGLSIPPRKDRITQTAIGGIVEDIVSANNGFFTSVTISSGPSYVLGDGEKAKLNSISFIP